MQTSKSKADKKKDMVSRKENEEILIDDNGNAVLTAEIEENQMAYSGLNGVKFNITKEIDLDSGQSIDSQREGIED